MQHIFIEADPAELEAWMRGECTQIAVPPPPNRITKTFICTVMSRDVVVLPATLFSNVRSEPLDRK
jgi:hypothetical protein